MNVPIRRMGDEFGETADREDRDAATADGGVAAQGDDGDAHPEGIAGGGDAVVGEGIEGDVDAVIEAVIFEAGLCGGELEAIGFDAANLQEGADALAGIAGSLSASVDIGGGLF